MADKRIPALPSATVPLAGTEVLPVVQSGITDQVSVANLTAGRAVTMLSNTMVSASAVNDVDKTGGGAYSYRAKGNDQANVRFRFENTGGQIYEIVGGNPGASNAGFAIFDATASATRMYIGSTGDITANTGNLVIGTAGKGIDFSATAHLAGMTSELLNDYEEGTWTPADGSGAGLILTFGVTPYYTKIGNVVTCNMDVIFPVTVSTDIARISLPFAPKVNGAGGNIGYTTKTGGMYLSLSSGGSFVFTDLTSNFLTNANMSTTRSQLSFSYIAA